MPSKLMSRLFPEAGRIFINYRRDDTRWAAGRLADSLSVYFDDDRVFRDVDDIRGGEDFTDKLDETLDRSDALIALIGPNWLTEETDAGQPRIHADGDWVVQEIAAALAKDMRIYPVLVDGAQMPAAKELPESIRELASRNAVSVSDESWDADITRLAQIVGLDIPSSTVRRLTVTNWLVVLLLWLPVLFVLGFFALDLGKKLPPSWYSTNWSGWFSRNYDDSCTAAGGVFPEALELLATGIVAWPYIALTICCAILFATLRFVHRKRRKLLRNAALVGSGGILTAFMATKPICTEFEPLFLFLFYLVIVIAVLGFMSLSGFLARQ